MAIFLGPLPLPGAGDRGANISHRLAVIRTYIKFCEKSVMELEHKLTSLILDRDPDEPIHTADETENGVRQQLYAARACAGEARSEEGFWVSLRSANQGLEQKTADLAKGS